MLHYVLLMRHHWYPVAEGHEETLEDPIPVPDSATIFGFEYEYGKYYSEGLHSLDSISK